MSTGRATPRPPAAGVVPLRDRPVDLVLVLASAAFFLVAVTLDAALALGVPLDASSDDSVAHLAAHAYVSAVDPLLAENPPFVRVMAAVNALVFGPFYAVLAYALVRGRAWVRLPALLYSAAMSYNMVIVIGVHLLADHEHRAPLALAVLNLPFLLVPLTLGWRMRHGEPFGLRPTARS